MSEKSFVCKPEIGPKQFDKLKPEPGPTQKGVPDFQLSASEYCYDRF